MYSNSSVHRVGSPEIAAAGALLAMFAMLLMAAGAAAAAEPTGPHPLEPPDRSSPRATMRTLTESVDEAVALYQAGDPGYPAPYAVAQRCIDASRVAPRSASRAVGEATLQLKEILDRIELPPASQIPDEARVRAEGLSAWTIPHTDLELVRLEEGDQAGEFVFSAATVERVAEYFARVRHLPYRPGERGASYDELRFGTESRLLRSIVDRLPSSSKREVGGQLLWQWVGLVLVVVVGALLAVAALRAGRKHKRPPSESRGLNRLWAFVGPATLIALALWLRYASFEYFRIWGEVGIAFRIAMTVVAMYGGAWLTAVLITRGAEHVILAGNIERPLSRQLIRVSARVLTLLLIVGWIFFAGERLGLPLTAMVAGLGVGGLAVALAAQGTIENLIGGISLFADQPVRVGDALKLNGRIGVLEEVGLRSAKIRTTADTVVTVPNAEFAKLSLENMSRREKTLLQTSLRIRSETTGDQLRYLLVKLHAMLLEHPKLDAEMADAKLVGFGDYFLEIQIQGFATTTNWPLFKEIRQDVFLRAMEIVEEAGTALAMPSQMQYAAGESAPDPDRARAAERQVAEWRGRGELPIAEFPAAGE